MLLERHFDPKRPINIHELSVEAPERATFDIQRELEALKNSPFYEKGRERWRLGLKEDQESFGHPINIGCHTRSEFLAILAEAQFDGASAKRHYEALKEMPLYDKGAKLWKSFMADNGHSGSAFSASEQLFAVLIDLQFDARAGRDRYENLLGTLLFDKELHRWNENIDRRDLQRENFSTSKLSDDQLLAIFIESFFNKEAAKDNYAQLKESNFYRKGERRWRWHVDREGNIGDDFQIQTTSQLMGVLLEAQFDKRAAREQYEGLKETGLFDKERKQWVNSLSRRNTIDPLRQD